MYIIMMEIWIIAQVGWQITETEERLNSEI